MGRYMLSLDKAKTEVPRLQEKARRWHSASDAAKSIVRVIAIEIPVNNQTNTSPGKVILPLKSFLIDLFNCFKILFD